MATSNTAATPRVIQFSDLLKAPVVARSGETIGRLEDVIVRLRGSDRYPLVTGYVVDMGGRTVFISADVVSVVAPDRIELSKNKVDLRGFERRDGEYLLDEDVLDHRFIDVDNAELVHAYDIELQETAEGGFLPVSILVVPQGFSVLSRLARARLGGIGKPSNP